jgi:L-aspartate oxidase
MVAGVGLNDAAAVDVLVREGPTRVRELMRWGADFDRHADGSLMLTREGGHHADRIVHAGGDATGAEVQRALHAAVRPRPVDPHGRARAGPRPAARADGRACGITLHVLARAARTGSARCSAGRSCSPPAAWARCTR